MKKISKGETEAGGSNEKGVWQNYCSGKETYSRPCSASFQRAKTCADPLRWTLARNQQLYQGTFSTRNETQHRVYGNVAITNEYNSSKTYSFCFSKVILHRARRTVDGKARVVRLHRAVECVHPQCLARRINHTTKGMQTWRRILLFPEPPSSSHPTTNHFLLFAVMSITQGITLRKNS